MKIQEILQLIEENCVLLNNGAFSDNGGEYAFVYADMENEIVVDFDGNNEPFNISISPLEKIVIKR